MAETFEQSVCRKLYEAAIANRGVRLTADEVFSLVRCDDAVGTRISNEAASQAGLGVWGSDCITANSPKTWRAFVRSFAGLTEPKHD